MRAGVTGRRFPFDWDQRPTVNAYGGYRLRTTVNLNLRFAVAPDATLRHYERDSYETIGTSHSDGGSSDRTVRLRTRAPGPLRSGQFR